MLNAEKILKLAYKQDFESIVQICEEEIRLKTAQEKGGATLASRTKAALKYLGKAYKYNEKFGLSWHEDRKQCFTNGYTGFILENDLEIPACEQEAMRLSRCFPKNLSEYHLVNIDLSDVKAKIKLHKVAQAAIKAKDRTPCLYQIEGSYYNADYILDCYNILGGDIVFKQSDFPKSPAVLESENGKAILMPFRTPQK